MAKYNFSPVTEVRASENMVLNILALPFGSEYDRDSFGTWFNLETETGIEEGDRRPTTRYHGKNKRKKQVISQAQLIEASEEGLIFRTVLPDTEEGRELYRAAEEKKLYSSTGALGYLTEIEKSGFVRTWIIGEVALLDSRKNEIPANWRAIAEPGELAEQFRASELELPVALAKRLSERQDKEENRRKKKMNKNELKKLIDQVMQEDKEEDTDQADIMRAAVQDAFDPVFDALGFEKTEQGKRKAPAFLRLAQRGFNEQEQIRSFTHWAVTGDQKPAWEMGLSAEKGMLSGMRADKQFGGELPEEGLVLIPPSIPDFILNEPEADNFISRYNVHVWRADSNVVPVPYEKTAMSDFTVVTGEVGAMTDDKDAPEVGVMNVTNYLWKKLVPFGMQLLSASPANVETYLTRRINDALNNTIIDKIVAGTGNTEPLGLKSTSALGVTAASATDIAAGEPEDLFYSIYQQGRKRGFWICSAAVHSELHQLLIATPRAYKTDVVANLGEMETLLGRPVEENDNMDATATGLKPLIFADPEALVYTSGLNMAAYRLREGYIEHGLNAILVFMRFGFRQVLDNGAKHLLMA